MKSAPFGRETARSRGSRRACAGSRSAAPFVLRAAASVCVELLLLEDDGARVRAASIQCTAAPIPASSPMYVQKRVGAAVAAQERVVEIGGPDARSTAGSSRYATAATMMRSGSRVRNVAATPSCVRPGHESNGKDATRERSRRDRRESRRFMNLLHGPERAEPRADSGVTLPTIWNRDARASKASRAMGETPPKEAIRRRATFIRVAESHKMAPRTLVTLHDVCARCLLGAGMGSATTGYCRTRREPVRGFSRLRNR